MKNLKRAKFLFVFSLILIIAVSGASGFFIGRKYEERNTKQTIDGVDFTIFWDSYKLLKEKYVGEVDPQKFLYGAINGGFSSTGDPYTVFLSPENAAELQQELSGELEGIGLKLGVLDGLPTVIAPLPGSPAEQAGLKPKDKILKVDDFVTEGQPLDLVVNKIRGKSGTKVKLIVRRSGKEANEELELTRQKIEVKSIESKYLNDVLVITINEFGLDTNAEFEAIYKEASQKGITKVVLDLRGNPGGLLNSSVEIAEYFLKSGDTIVIEQGKKDRTEEKVQKERGWQDAKLAIIVDEGSASASEILAGAIKDKGRGKIYGQKTFGKGTVQELLPLEDGSSTKITISKWLTPNGHDIDKNGIEPDVKLEEPENRNFNDNDSVLNRAIADL